MRLLIRDRTKRGDGRVVVLDAGTVAAIEAWRRKADEIVGAPTEWMLSEAGAAVPPSPRWLYEVFMRAAKRAGIPAGRDKGIVLHDLRHWVASTAQLNTVALDASFDQVQYRATVWDLGLDVPA